MVAIPCPAPADTEILGLLKQRLSVKEVAQVLMVSEWTVVKAIPFGGFRK